MDRPHGAPKSWKPVSRSEAFGAYLGAFLLETVVFGIYAWVAGESLFGGASSWWLVPVALVFVIRFGLRAASHLTDRDRGKP